MKTLKKNDEYKRVPDSYKKDIEKIDKLLDSGWSFAPKKEWKEWKVKSAPKKESKPVKNTKRGKG